MYKGRVFLSLIVGALLLAFMPITSAGAASIPNENVVFLYRPVPIAAIGHPRDIVFGTANKAVQAADTNEVALAHSLGARAFKYEEVTLFPDPNPWLGTDPIKRTQWTLCNSGKTPLYEQRGPVRWSYADPNEVGYVNAVLAWTAQLKAAGYDGVFMDGGGRAMHGPYSNVSSTCTGLAVTPHATAAAAWMSLMARIKAQGLLVTANLGDSNPDPLFTWVLHENAGHPKEDYGTDSVRPLLAPFERLAGHSVDDSPQRSRIVEMAKARLGGTDPNRLKQEEYVWGLAKLSGAPVVLNTGNDWCGVTPGTTDCSRTGLSALLTDTHLGTPLDATPYQLNGMWVRRFTKGLVVVSAYGTAPRTGVVALGTPTCVRVHSVRGQQQAANQCVKSLGVSTNQDRYAHIYTYTP